MSTNKFTASIVLGLDDSHIDYDSFEAPVAKDCVNDIRKLKDRASSAGFDLQIASGYRNYERQLGIWNAKASGKRPLLDQDEIPQNFSDLSEEQIVKSILTWSALPGASRHHWGSDFDVFDKKALPEGHKLQLTLKECDQLFAPFYSWLAAYLAEQECPFFRPYVGTGLKLAREPWHLSHKKISGYCESLLTVELLEEYVNHSQIMLKDVVLERLSEIYKDYVKS